MQKKGVSLFAICLGLTWLATSTDSTMAFFPISQGALVAYADHFYVLKNRQKVIVLRAFDRTGASDPLTYSIIQAPLNGQLVGTPPDLTYVPSRDFIGQDTLTFAASNHTITTQAIITLDVGAAFIPPVGMAAPPFGVAESHRMYVGASYNFGRGLEPYHDAGNGPYTHYVDFNRGNDLLNTFGTQVSPRKTIPGLLAPGSVVEVHGSGFNTADPYVIRGNGTAAQPIFIRGADGLNKPVFRRALKIEGNYIVCENLEFDCRDFGVSAGYPAWFSVSEQLLPILQTFHHVSIRHSLFHDCPDNSVGDVVALSFGVSHTPNVSPNTATDLIQYVVAYDVEVRNFSVWDNYATGNDFGGCYFAANCRYGWLLDSHLHGIRGDAAVISRNDALSNQTPARDICVGRNYIHNCRENCLDIKNGVGAIVSQNRMHTVRLSATSMGDAIPIHNDDATSTWPYSDNIWVIFNEIYDAERGVNCDMQTTSALPVLPTNRDARVYIVGNEIHDIRAIRGSPAFYGQAISNSAMTQCRIVNNTIYHCEKGIYVGQPNGTAFWRSTAAVRNNLVDDIVTERDPTGRHISVGEFNCLPYTAIDHNCHWGNVSFDVRNIGWVFSTVTAMLAQTGLGLGSRQADPMLVNPGALDLHPVTASPCNSSGITDNAFGTFRGLYPLFNIESDFDGTRFPVNRYSMGALLSPKLVDGVSIQRIAH